MNILMIYDGYTKVDPDIGSVAKVAFYISKYMVKLGHNVTILERQNSATEPATEYIDGIRFVRIESKRLASHPLKEIGHFPLGPVRLIIDGIRFALKANKYLGQKDNNFDVVQMHFPLANNILLFLNRKLRNKAVYTAHSDEYKLNLSSSLKLPWYLRLITPDLFLMKRVKKVVVLNDSIRSKLIAAGKVQPQDIVTIPNGLDINKFNPDIDVREVKQKYELDNKVTILFVGGIMPRKGLEYLIKAANTIINHLSYANALFLLVGSYEASEYTDRVVKLIQDYGLEKSVKMTGFVDADELAKLQMACDIFVLPSLEEGFGMVLTEAMAFSKPVIGTNVGGILTQIGDGWNGLLVEPGNEADLAEKIRYLVDHPEERLRMGANGRKRAEDEFSWEKIAEEYIKAYQQVQTEK